LTETKHGINLSENLIQYSISCTKDFSVHPSGHMRSLEFPGQLNSTYLTQDCLVGLEPGLGVKV